MVDLFDGKDRVYVTCKKCGREIEIASHASRLGDYTTETIKGNAFCEQCELFFQWDGRHAHFEDGVPLIRANPTCPHCGKFLLLSQPLNRCPYCKKDLPKKR